MRPDMKLRRNLSSCSQYQSEDTWVRLRKRASLRFSARSASLRSVMSSRTAISYSGAPPAPRTSAMARSTHTTPPSPRR